MDLKSNQLVFLLFVVIVIPCFAVGNGGNNQDIEEYSSNELKEKCDSLMKRLKTDSDDPEILGHAKLVVKDRGNFIVNGNKACAMIIGCTGFGELILLDSCGGEAQFRQELIIPGKHAYIGNILDINSDGYDDIRLDLSAGAHGYYSYFLSVYTDSLSYIKKNNESYSFFAATGGISVKDIDNDGVYELIVDHMLEEGQKENYTIYKWNGHHYSIDKKIER
jgi:hypothetical protein